MSENKENVSFENYEKNLKLQLESKRKDLDIQLTSIIPNQIVLVRLYLWFSTLIVAGILTIFSSQIKSLYFNDFFSLQTFIILSIIVTVSLSIYCIFLCFIAILNISNRYFPGDAYEKLAKLEMNNLEHVNGLNEMINETFAAYKENDKIIHKAAKSLRQAFWCNFTSLIFFIFFIIILAISLSKGGEKMANEKKVDKPVASMTGKPNIVQTSNISQERFQDKIIANKNQPKSDQNQTKNKK
ncbi:TPA: hypothetical protein RTG46_001728 [Campylobacter jejuni]|nr:hypothetical protein [Campylobacter jejuni]HDZ5012312.1 hypothetical protein [Campylobacter jejuni]HDZ5015987.1 hypothetical protein [Campylobacter jejuni]HDZ5024125.1 hypothetical protein [Campylobacter jejuni]HDZ5032942.1 hypothetical protein [Campylobacter jejuni]